MKYYYKYRGNGYGPFKSKKEAQIDLDKRTEPGFEGRIFYGSTIIEDKCLSKLLLADEDFMASVNKGRDQMRKGEYLTFEEVFGDQ